MQSEDRSAFISLFIRQKKVAAKKKSGNELRHREATATRREQLGQPRKITMQRLPLLMTTTALAMAGCALTPQDVILKSERALRANGPSPIYRFQPGATAHPGH